MSCINNLKRIGLVWIVLCSAACDSGGKLNIGLETDAGTDTETQTGSPESQLAMLGDDGRLIYGQYAAVGESNTDHRLPDFSFAGYMGGGVAIPSAEVKRTLSPVDGDDRAQIQAAIDYVAGLPVDDQGLRGAILLRRGTYEVGDALHISKSGIVLRGEGEGLKGSILVATKPEKHDFINIIGSGSGFGEVSGSRVRISSPYVGVGATTVELESPPTFNVGDTIVVLRTPNQTWVDALGMDQWGWKPSSYAIGHERRVVALQGNSLTIDIPLVDSITAAHGGGSVYLANVEGRISQCGVEDLRLHTIYASNTDEDHGKTGIRFERVINSWVRRVTVQYFQGAVVFSGESNFNTVEDTASLDPKATKKGGTRYSFLVDDGLGNLFQRCYSRNGRHNFVTGSRVTGPNVWLDCLAVNNINDDGPHHRWATGLLFDNTSSTELHVQNRASSGSGHGWAGAQILFWNVRANAIICDAPLGSINWAIGCEGERRKSARSDEADGWWEAENTPVGPRSLYLQQLQDRLGPDAVMAVTTKQQREGRVWDAIAAWAKTLTPEPAPSTDPHCENGIYYDLACCAASCGVCEESGCSDRPGGEAACCESVIRDNAVSCSTTVAPCLVD